MIMLARRVTKNPRFFFFYMQNRSGKDYYCYYSQGGDPDVLNVFFFLL